jgi:hypothetical protein
MSSSSLLTQGLLAARATTDPQDAQPSQPQLSGAPLQRVAPPPIHTFEFQPHDTKTHPIDILRRPDQVQKWESELLAEMKRDDEANSHYFTTTVPKNWQGGHKPYHPQNNFPYKPNPNPAWVVAHRKQVEEKQKGMTEEEINPPLKPKKYARVYRRPSLEMPKNVRNVLEWNCREWRRAYPEDRIMVQDNGCYAQAYSVKMYDQEE